MSVRETSIEAYYKALYGGKIGERRQEVLTIILEWDLPRHVQEIEVEDGYGLSAMEVWKKFIRAEEIYLIYDSNTRARFTELRRMGLLYENGTKVCSVTNQTVIAWMPTWFRKIEPLGKPETKDQKIARLEAELVECQNTVAKAHRWAHDRLNRERQMKIPFEVG